MLGPYEPNSVHAGDCAALMADLPAGCIDLTVTSPPYDNLRDYNGYHFDFEAIAAQLWRVTKPGGVVVWVVADATIDGSETGTSFKQALHFMSLGFNLHDTMIYEVAGTGAKGSNYAYWQAFEYMFVLSKGRPETVNRIKDKVNKWAGHTSSPSMENSHGRKGGYRTIPDTGYRTNIWRYSTVETRWDTHERGIHHSAAFPPSLARDHIMSWSNAGDIVLDPMCGSGTTLKMAHETGRVYLGFDISEEYCELARRRTQYARTPLPFLEAT